MQFSKCRPCLYSTFPLNTQRLWPLCLLSFPGTSLFTCKPTKLGKATVTALSKAANVLKSWRICTQGGPGAVPQTPSHRGQQLPSALCPSAQPGRAGRVVPHRYPAHPPSCLGYAAYVHPCEVNAFSQPTRKIHGELPLVNLVGIMSCVERRILL